MHSKILVVLTALPILVSAQEFNYTFVEGGYVDSDIDTGPFNSDGDGLGIRGSFAINDKFHAFGAHATQDLDLDIDTDQLEFGVGRHWSLRENVDLDNSNTSLSFSGRYFLWDNFAIGGGLEFDDDDTAWNIGVRAEFGSAD